MHNFAKLIVMLAFLAVVIGCVTEETYHMVEPEPTQDARIIGTIHGVVRDGSNNALLPNVEVQLTRGDNLLVRRTSSAGHYSFGNLNPGRYTLTFVFPDGNKAVAEAYAAGVNRQRVPDWDDLGWTYSEEHGWPWNWASGRDFHYEIVCDMKLFPLTGTVSGRVFDQDMEPVVGAVVVADFASQYLAVNQFFSTPTNAMGEYTFTNLPSGMESCGPPDDGGILDKSLPGEGGTSSDPYDGPWGHWGELDGCFYGTLRTQPVTIDGRVLMADPVELDLQWGSYLADDLILRSAHAPRIAFRNFGSFDPDSSDPTLFPVDVPFVARFNVAMDPATFVAELRKDGELVPVTTQVFGNLVTVSPHSHLFPEAYYTLRLAGYSTDLPHYFDSEWNIRTAGVGQPEVLSKNWHDGAPFPVDGHFELVFNTLMRDDFSAVLYKMEYGKAGHGDILIPTETEVEGNVVTVTPEDHLVLNANYRLELYGFSIAGRAFEDHYEVSTLSVPAPSIVASNFDDCGVSPYSNLVAIFDMPMDPATFVVHLRQRPDLDLIPVEVTWTGMTVVMEPEELLYETEYWLHITGHSLQGGPFEDSWEFMTLGPQAVQVVSKNFEIGIPIRRDITFEVTFNQAMDPDRFSAELRTGGNIVYIEEPWWDGHTVYVQPLYLLDAGTDYTLYLWGFSEANEDWSHSYGVMPTLAEPNYPRSVATLVNIEPVPLDAVLNVEFSLPVLTETVEIDFLQGAVAVLYAHEWVSDTHLALTPVLELDLGTTYTIQITGLSEVRTRIINEAGVWNPATLQFRTVGEGQDVRVIAHNLRDNYPLDEDPWVLFSAPMNPDSFDGPYADGLITLTQNAADWPFVASWQDGNTRLVLELVDPFLPTRELKLELEGESADGIVLSSVVGGVWQEGFEFEWMSLYMDPPVVVATNVVSEEFQPYAPDGLTPPEFMFEFSTAIDIDTIELMLYRFVEGGPGVDDDWIEVGYPALTAANWTAGNTVLTFSPYVRLVPGTEYWLAISGECTNGLNIDGGLYHEDVEGYYGAPIPGFDPNYFYPFHTAGDLLAFVRHDIYRVDGSYQHIPRDEPRMILYFNAAAYGEVLDLEAPDTEIVLWNFGERAHGDTPPVASGYPKEVAIHVEQIADGVIEIQPVIMPLEANTLYWITYNVCTTLENDCTASGPATGNNEAIVFDITEDIVFRTSPEIDVAPVAMVTGLEKDDDFFADYDHVFVELVWDHQDDADGYYVYARIDDGEDTKSDYLRVPTGGVTLTIDEDEGTVEAVVAIDSQPFQDRFQTRDSPIYTPFDGQAIQFRVSAYNDLGEGEKSVPLSIEDEVSPTGGVFTAQDGSADNSAGAVEIEVELTFQANEYLTHDPATVDIEIAEGFVETGFGDPEYVLELDDITVTFEDDLVNARTEVVITFAVPAGVNAAGDLVTVTVGGLMDTSGNLYDDDDPDPWELEDETPPVLTPPAPALAQVGSANNTVDLPDGIGMNPRMMTVRFVSSELLNDAIDHTNTLEVWLLDPDEVLADIDITGLVDDVRYDDTNLSYSIIEVDVAVPWLAEWAGWAIALLGVEDLVGNVIADFEPVLDEAWELLNLTPPGASISDQNPALADNTGNPAALWVEFTITVDEPAVTSVIPEIEVDGQTWQILPSKNTGWINNTTYVFVVRVPDDTNATGEEIHFWNITSVATGNTIPESQPYIHVIE